MLLNVFSVAQILKGRNLVYAMLYVIYKSYCVHFGEIANFA